MKLAVAKLVAFLTLGLLAVPLAAVGQQAGKVYRIGVVSSGRPEQESVLQATLRERLRERGWVEGQNLVVEWRYAEGKYERASELVDELVRLKPDLLMTRGGPVTTAAKRAVATIPIVMWGVTDPAGIGVVASLARPGGNVTGLTESTGPEIVGKRLQLLKEAVSRMSRVAVLDASPSVVAVLRNVAPRIGVKLLLHAAKTAADLTTVLAAIARERADGLLVLASAITDRHVDLILNVTNSKARELILIPL